MQVSCKDFKRVRREDADADISWLGTYSHKGGEFHIDRKECGHMRGREYRYFNLGTGDVAYIEDDYKRAEAFGREWYCIGLSVMVQLKIPHGTSFILQKIESPGLWGIESDSGEQYFREVFAEEAATLIHMLTEMGMTVIDRDVLGKEPQLPATETSPPLNAESKHRMVD